MDDVYNAIVAKGTTPASKSLSDVIQGIADIETIHTATYSASSRASNLDMGESHEYRYIDTNSVPNTNASTYSVDSNGIKDMGATNSYRYVNVNVPHPTHTTTYKPTSRASNNDMGATHLYRYVDTTAVPNSNSGTYGSVTSNGVKDMGATNSYRYVNVQVPHPTHTTTYSATSRASNLDMGATHSYRYVNTDSVPNTNSATYGSVTSNGVKDMGATNSYRYVNVNVPTTIDLQVLGSSQDTAKTYTLPSTNTLFIANIYNSTNIRPTITGGDVMIESNGAAGQWMVIVKPTSTTINVAKCSFISAFYARVK